MTALSLCIDWIDTPIGDLLVAVDDDGRLRAVYFVGPGVAIGSTAGPPSAPRDAQAVHALLTRACGVRHVAFREVCDPAGCRGALQAYFAGDLAAIDRLEVAPAGTPFQRGVWAALREIPCGTTQSYGALARRLGRPDASRAVGFANGANPVAVVIPCHRVIGANGSLTGYGGGLDRKRWLLDHEARRARPTLF